MVPLGEACAARGCVGGARFGGWPRAQRSLRRAPFLDARAAAAAWRRQPRNNGGDGGGRGRTDTGGTASAHQSQDGVTVAAEGRCRPIDTAGEACLRFRYRTRCGHRRLLWIGGGRGGGGLVAGRRHRRWRRPPPTRPVTATAAGVPQAPGAGLTRFSLGRPPLTPLSPTVHPQTFRPSPPPLSTLGARGNNPPPRLQASLLLDWPSACATRQRRKGRMEQGRRRTRVKVGSTSLVEPGSTTVIPSTWRKVALHKVFNSGSSIHSA